MKSSNCLYQYLRRPSRILHSLSSYKITQKPQASYGTTAAQGGKYKIIDHTYDAVIVGAGGAGLRTASYLAKEGFKTACISKVLPNRSQTVASYSGLNVQLRASNTRNTIEESDMTYNHFAMTCQNSQFSADADSACVMAEEARKSVLELDSQGFPFARNSDGKLQEKDLCLDNLNGHNYPQNCFGSVYTDNGIGHDLLETFLTQALKFNCNFFNEYLVLDLIMDESNTCRGVICMSLADGSIHRIRSHYTILAAGGYSGVFPVSTSTRSCTGDGLGIATRAGLPLQDLEYIEVAPTCLYGSGQYLNKSLRMAGGLLVNSEKIPFMEKYAPYSKDLRKNQMLVRAMQFEIEEGRGVGESKDHLHLQLHHINPDVIQQQLPGLAETMKFYANIDITKESIPITPAAHKSVGGVPTNFKAEVVTQNKKGENVIVPGLLSIGENACSGAHGAVIMEGNSLSEVVAFGKQAALTVKNQLKHGTLHKELPFQCEAKSLDWLDKMRNSSGNSCYSTQQIKMAMQQTMQGYLKVYIQETEIASLISELDAIYEQAQHLKPIEKSLIWNTDLIERLELSNLLACSKQVLQAGLMREVTIRTTPRKRNEYFKKHSLTWFNGNKVEVTYKDMVIENQNNVRPYPFISFY